MQPDAPQSVIDEARGVKPHGKVAQARQRRGAVSFLLGQQRPPRYKLKIEFATDEGDMPLWLMVHSLDAKRIDAIEKAHTDRDSPFGDMNELEVNAELVADALMTISDGEPGTPEFDEGDVTKLDEEFRGDLASNADALRARFHWQEGLLSGVASQVRRISGWAPDRVGQAQRVLVDVAGNS